MNDDGGPFRSVLVPREPATPPHLIVRRDENELIIEKRRRFEGAPRLMLAGVGVFGLFIGLQLGGWTKAIFGLMIAAAALTTMTTFWERTTLKLRADGFSLVERRLLRTRRFAGSLASLEVTGVFPVTTPGIDDNVEVLCIDIAVDHQPVQILRAVPRDELDWVMAQIRDWRATHLDGESSS